MEPGWRRDYFLLVFAHMELEMSCEIVALASLPACAVEPWKSGKVTVKDDHFAMNQGLVASKQLHPQYQHT